MSIIFRLAPESSFDDANVVATVRISGGDSLENFRMLVRRALNVWDRAPAELKEFGDLVDHGKILQDYRSQE